MLVHTTQWTTFAAIDQRTLARALASILSNWSELWLVLPLVVIAIAVLVLWFSLNKGTVCQQRSSRKCIRPVSQAQTESTSSQCHDQLDSSASKFTPEPQLPVRSRKMSNGNSRSKARRNSRKRKASMSSKTLDLFPSSPLPAVNRPSISISEDSISPSLQDKKFTCTGAQAQLSEPASSTSLCSSYERQERGGASRTQEEIQAGRVQEGSEAASCEPARSKEGQEKGGKHVASTLYGLENVRALSADQPIRDPGFDVTAELAIIEEALTECLADQNVTSEDLGCWEDYYANRQKLQDRIDRATSS